MKMFKMSKIMDYPSEPDSLEVREAKQRWTSASAEYTALKKILDKVTRHMDQYSLAQDSVLMWVAEDMTVLADHLSSMSGNKTGNKATVFLSMAEAERAVSNCMWRLIPTFDDDVVGALQTALEGKPDELVASKEEYKRRKRELAKARKKKPQEGEPEVDIVALEGAADVAGRDLSRMLDNVREDRALAVAQAIFSALSTHASLETAAAQTLDDCTARASVAAQALGLRAAPIAAIGEISAPTNVKHVGGAGLSRLANTNNIDLRDDQGIRKAKEKALDMAFPTRAATDDKLKGPAPKGEDEASPPSDSSEDEGAAPPPPAAQASAMAPSFPRIPAPAPPAAPAPASDLGGASGIAAWAQAAVGAPGSRPARPPPQRPPPARPPPVPSNPPPGGSAQEEAQAAEREREDGAAADSESDAGEEEAGAGAGEDGAGNEAAVARGHVVSTTSTVLVQGDEVDGARRAPSYQEDSDSDAPATVEATAVAGGSEAAEGDAGWEAFRDDAGNVYFHNSETGVTQWERPEGFDGEPDSSDDD